MTMKPIYVETLIAADMEALWRHTQSPELHQQWDLRFSEINYLPKEQDGQVSAQRFRYRTRIGFGLDIAGTGETAAVFHAKSGERTSTLRFGSEQRISLIREGSGYWKYKPQHPDGPILFMTQYDYKTRFGKIGALFDRFVFRPLFGYATAWSFDALRLWLEEQIAPSVSIQRAIVHYLSILLLASIWLYEGLVPKLLFPQGGELELIQQLGWFPGRETAAVQLLGAAEMIGAILMLVWHRRPAMYAVQSAVLLLLAVAAIMAQPYVAAAPFNPIVITVPMIGLSLIAAYTLRQLPSAARCRRKPLNMSGL